MQQLSPGSRKICRSLGDSLFPLPFPPPPPFFPIAEQHRTPMRFCLIKIISRAHPANGGRRYMPCSPFIFFFPLSTCSAFTDYTITNRKRYDTALILLAENKTLHGCGQAVFLSSFYTPPCPPFPLFSADLFIPNVSRKDTCCT